MHNTKRALLLLLFFALPGCEYIDGYDDGYDEGWKHRRRERSERR